MVKIVGLDLSINGSGCVKISLNNNLNIINIDYIAFSNIKKNTTDKIFLLRNKDFKNYIDRNLYSESKILSYCNDCDFCAIEDYSYGSSAGQVFHIAEFIGSIKKELYKNNKKIRLYDPNSIKMFATKLGNADKRHMNDAYEKLTENTIDLSKLKPNKSPREDIIDAYYIVMLLRQELMLRKGIIQLKDLDEKNIRIYNRITKKFPINLLDRDFLYLDE